MAESEASRHCKDIIPFYGAVRAGGRVLFTRRISASMVQVLGDDEAPF